MFYTQPPTSDFQQWTRKGSAVSQGKASTSCCGVHWAVGCAVTLNGGLGAARAPARPTRRGPCSRPWHEKEIEGNQFRDVPNPSVRGPGKWWSWRGCGYPGSQRPLRLSESAGRPRGQPTGRVRTAERPRAGDPAPRARGGEIPSR